MGTYRVTLTDRLGMRYGIIPAYGETPIQFSSVLNGGGSATLTPNLMLPLWSGPTRRNRLSRWASELYIERLDGFGQTGLVWEGPVTKPHADIDSNSLTITCGSPWAWADERDIDTPRVYGGWDQLDVARDLVSEYLTAKRGPAWDARFAVGGGKSGVQVNEQYQPTDGKILSGVMGELSGATNGFDFDVLSYLDGEERVRRTFMPYYPAKGRTLSTTLRKGVGGLRAFSLEEATQIATRARGTNTGSYVARVADTIEARYGVHSRSISATDSNSLAKMRAQIDDYLHYRMPDAALIISFQYQVTKETPFGFIQTGDTVPVYADRGWASHDDSIRVIGTSTSVDKNGVEVVTCTAAGVPGGLS